MPIPRDPWVVRVQRRISSIWHARTQVYAIPMYGVDRELDARGQTTVDRHTFAAIMAAHLRHEIGARAAARGW